MGGYPQKLLVPGGRCGWRKLEARAEDRVGAGGKNTDGEEGSPQTKKFKKCQKCEGGTRKATEEFCERSE